MVICSYAIIEVTISRGGRGGHDSQLKPALQAGNEPQNSPVLVKLGIKVSSTNYVYTKRCVLGWGLPNHGCPWDIPAVNVPEFLVELDSHIVPNPDVEEWNKTSLKDTVG